MDCNQFTDHLVPYQQFLEDIASLVVKKMKLCSQDPEFVSQNKAFQMFGRKNVERWRSEGKIFPAVRPGKHQYRTANLRYLQSQIQDYFSNK